MILDCCKVYQHYTANPAANQSGFTAAIKSYFGNQIYRNFDKQFVSIMFSGVGLEGGGGFEWGGYMEGEGG